MLRLCFIIRRDVSSYNVISFRSDSSSNISRRVESASALNIKSLFHIINLLYATYGLLVNNKQPKSCILSLKYISRNSYGKISRYRRFIFTHPNIGGGNHEESKSY